MLIAVVGALAVLAAGPAVAAPATAVPGAGPGPLAQAVGAGHAPIGRVDAVTAGPGAVVVAGWALDPDNTSSIPVTVYLDGQPHPFATDLARADVGAAHPGYGDLHGFSALLSASPGTHQVCVTAVNSGPGSDTSLGCQAVALPGGDPFGTIDIAGPAHLTGTDIRVAGWVIDPEVFGPTQVAVYIDDQGAWFPAGAPRSDVAAAHPGSGDAHGFDVTIPSAAGTHQACAYGINVGVGTNALLGCRTVTVPRHEPFGTIDTIDLAPDRSFAAVAGWALDPDTTAPTQVAVYVGDRGAWYLADTPRDDVATAFPGSGPDHGFRLWVPIPAGATEVAVCAYGINTGPGGNSLLACRSVTIPATGTIHGTYSFGYQAIPTPASGEVAIRGGDSTGTLWVRTDERGAYSVDVIPGSYDVTGRTGSHVFCNTTTVVLATGASVTADVSCAWR